MKTKRPIKICFIARTAYHLLNPDWPRTEGSTHGGAEVDLFLLAIELAKNDKYDISFITGDYGQNRLEIHNNVKTYACFEYYPSKNTTQLYSDKKVRFFKFINKVPVLRVLWTHVLMGHKINRMKNFKKLAVLFKEVDADIYIQEAASALTGVSCFLSKVFGKKFVYRTAHDIDCDGSYIREENDAGSADGFLYEWGIKHASWLITQNKKNQKDILNNHRLESEVIKNAYSIPESIPKEKDAILWVARSVDWKQPFMFLELAKEFLEEKFVMICPKANESGVDWNQLKKEVGEIENIEFIEYVPFQKIDNYFQKSKIFMNTSLYEGYPNTFVQAAKNGTPIVSLNVNPDNFLNSNKCGFFANGDLNLMKKQIKDLLSNQDRYKDMSQNAYDYVKREHDIENIIKKYENGFNRILG